MYSLPPSEMNFLSRIIHCNMYYCYTTAAAAAEATEMTTISCKTSYL